LISEIRRGRQDLHDENRIGKLPIDDLDAKILAILDKSSFESAKLIIETVCVGLTTIL
jgi:hypothetical protein